MSESENTVTIEAGEGGVTILLNGADITDIIEPGWRLTSEEGVGHLSVTFPVRLWQ